MLRQCIYLFLSSVICKYTCAYSVPGILQPLSPEPSCKLHSQPTNNTYINFGVYKKSQVTYVPPDSRSANPLHIHDHCGLLCMFCEVVHVYIVMHAQ